MATGKKTNFNSLAAQVLNQAQQSTEETTSTGKGKVTTFEIEPNLDEQLDRVVFWGGKKSSKKAVINAALAYYFSTSPEGKKNSQRPTPDEGGE
jgi:hypothetical protein